MSSVLRVFRYLRRYPGLAAATFLCAVLTTLAAFVFPKATGLIVDRVLVAHHPGKLWPYVLAIAAAFFARDAFNSLRIRLNNSYEQNVVRDLRCQLYDALQRLPLPWFEQRATGDLVTRVSEDVISVERVLIDGIEQGAISLLQIGGIGFLLFRQNPALAAWMLLPLPLIGLGAWLYSSTPDRYRAQRRAASAMNSLLLDNLQGIRQIKSYAREDEEGRRFAAAAEEVRTTQLWVMHVWALYNPAMNFLGALGTLIVLAVGGRDVLAGQFTAGQLVEFLLYVGMFYDPVGKLHQLNQTCGSRPGPPPSASSRSSTRRRSPTPRGWNPRRA
ncbi:MAG: ABC transporter transmembrane domain-containing protein [Verrucomicrobium sp.]|nr:ABC transporter transmembrane domain-containing protein [Verrucomicrobium sp.]